ncbi:MAG: flagellar hook-basal body complex protein FliE [Solirubrobacteraceae bacterium]|nr:flagellar hook-basal body complex protein FliE [Solirubrobacteraceae bacterium]
MPQPIDPSFLTSGVDWNVGGVGKVDTNVEQAEGPSTSSGFGSMLGQQIGKLQGLQEDAATQAQGLADGTAADATSVVMAVEKARLSMQLATQLRERGVTALQEVLRTQV